MSKVAALLSDLMAVIANHAKGLEDALDMLPATPVAGAVKVVADEAINVIEAKEAGATSPAPVAEQPAAAIPANDSVAAQ